MLGDEQVCATNIDRLRQNYFCVFNDFHIFDCGISEHEVQRAEEYLVLLKLSQKVTIVERKFSTVKLSTGQRKRLALVTALLSEKPILLFDEWAADQDPEFRDVFYFEIIPMLKLSGKTVIAITHDDRYFGCADRTIKLENGKIAAVMARQENLNC